MPRADTYCLEETLPTWASPSMQTFPRWWTGGWVYAAREYNVSLVKIGCTGNLSSRLQALPWIYHTPIVLVGAVHFRYGAFKVEHAIHVLLTAEHIEGEWFYLHMNQDKLTILIQQVFPSVEALACQERRGYSYDDRPRRDL